MGRNGLIYLARLGSAAALASALLAPAPAFAQDDVTLTMARERFKEGVAFFDQKQYAKARVAFLQAYALKKHPSVLLNLAQSELRSGREAYALKKHPSVLLNLAQSELRSGREADAAKHFAQYLREHREATDAERHGAENGLTAAKVLVAEVTVEVDTSEAEVYVDGALEARSPLSGAIYLAPGVHSLEARKGGKTVTTEIRASAGLSTTATLKLGASKAPATPAPVATDPELVPTDSEPADSEGRKAFFPWLADSPAAIVGVGLTGVGLISGVAFALGSKSNYDSANNVAAGITDEALGTDMKFVEEGICIDPKAWLQDETQTRTPRSSAYATEKGAQYTDNCKKFQDNVDTGDTFKTIAVVSFAVAGAAAAGTIIYYFAGSHEKADAARVKRTPKIAIAPAYQPGFAGALLTGSF